MQLGWIKSVVQTILMVVLFSVGLDVWRSPRQPLQDSERIWLTSSGRTIRLQDLDSSQTTLLYFWGSWCGICRFTSPVVNRLAEKGVPVMGVALQSGTDEEVQHYLRQNQWSFETINDDRGQLAREWKIKVTPTIALIKNGRVVHSTSGVSGYWGLYGRWLWVDWWY